MKILIPGLVAFAVWSWVCVQWYVCGIHELCDESSSVVENIEPQPESQQEDTLALATIEETEPAALSFDWSGSQPQLGPSFPDYRDSLQNIFNEDPAAVVAITGIYDPQELNDSDFANLGLARAQAVKDLLLSSGIKRAININSKTQDLSSYLGNQIKEGVSFSLESPIALDGFAVVRQGSKLIIHFPSNSDSPRRDNKVLNALRSLAKEVRQNQSHILVVGHTDSPGDEQKNRILGLKRAALIKDMLIEAGLEEKDIYAESEGEDQPLANNNTASGRRLNRRVELTII